MFSEEAISGVLQQVPKRPRRAMWVWLGVFGVALGARLMVATQTAGMGFYEAPQSDARIYVDRARGILDGKWAGEAEFVHAPSYSWFLAGLLSLFDGDLSRVPYAQAVVGACSAVLIAVTAGWWFGRGAGVVAGLFAALSPPLIFYDLIIQKTVLTIACSALTLWLIARTWSARSVWLAGLTGLSLGLLILTRQNALLLLPAMVLLLLLFGPRGWSFTRRLSGAGLMLFGAVLAISPWIVRNHEVLGEYVLTTPNLGQNFWMGNNPSGSGTYIAMERGRGSAEHEQRLWTLAAERETGHEMTAGEVSGFYLEKAWEQIWERPVDWAEQTGRKCLLLISAYEAPDTEDYYLFAEKSSVLHGLDFVLHFGVLGPLAAVGLVACWAERRKLAPLYVWLAIGLAAVALFVVFGRYRTLVLPTAILFAAVGAQALVKTFAQKRYADWCGLLAVCAAAAFVINWPYGGDRRATPLAYANHAVALAELDRVDDALKELDKGLDLDPHDADVHYVRGSILEDDGDFERALAHYRAAVEADPGFAMPYAGIGRILLTLGYPDRAAESFQHALDIAPDERSALIGLATARAKRGSPFEAIAILEKTIESHPDYAEAWLNLGNVQLQMGMLAQAEVSYRKAMELKPRLADAHYNLGVLFAMQQRIQEANEEFEAAVDVQPEHPRANQALKQLQTHQQNRSRGRHGEHRTPR